jgi:hypothetical protein
MFVAEVSLLRAVRNKLRDDLGLSASKCDIELDDQVPAIAPNLYVAVTPAGMAPGPRHAPSGGVYDVKISVRVTVFSRIAEVARDRRRNVFTELLTGLAVPLENIVDALDNNYALLAEAKALVDAVVDPPAHIAANATGEWPEPFREYRPDTTARMVFRDPFDAAQHAGPPADPIVAISRGVTFSGARYMRVRA